MRIVVIGGTGHIGRLVVDRIENSAQAVVVASRRTGVDALTGEGLDRALELADAVIDVTNAPHPDADGARDFFTTMTARVIEAELAAGVRHHIMLSIVGADREVSDGYFAAKAAQERVIADSRMPYTIVRSTQFFEFARSIAQWNTSRDTIHLPTTHVQPVAAEDVAATLVDVAAGDPIDGVVEVAGPERMPLPQFVSRVLLADRDERFVVADDNARTHGFNIASSDLLPGDAALVGTTTLDTWIREPRPR
ncbi:NmrA family transcriptional regulator [Microbacterium protaetiae]|uniref:NmrA family transcriptional regulator n=1 Tax=Microbacterium protaetiae TaxID=2509458 RepID=A0A4P6EFB7_9MICO|nr:NAD(P)H-binding protein [Microbacterium protaetiae]QAY60093.1 NmrA family transcriptional regulator [Microbacterium protaetiae]